MGNFVTGNTALPPSKTDANPPQGFSYELDASDINNLWSAAGDLRDQVQGWVNVKSSAYGAVGSGLVDDAPAIQAAWNAAVARGNGRLYFPAGTYRIDSPISLSPSTYFGATIAGESTGAVVIKAGASMTAMLSFTDVSQNGRFKFMHFALDGNSLAQYGIKSTKLAYSKFEHLDISGCTVAGMQLQDGWDNTIKDSEFHNNAGDGLVFAGNTANDLSLLNVLCSNNAGWGLKTSGGGPIVIRGGAFQLNAKGGIYVTALGRPFVADAVYFEANAQTGFTFTTPAKTVKADIVLNGSGVETTMAHAFPSPHVSIRNCLSNDFYAEAFIYVLGATAMDVRGNYGVTSTPLLKTYGDSTYALPGNVTISGNTGYSKEVDVESITANRTMAFSTFSSDTVQKRNYLANKSVYAIPKIFGAAGTTMVRGVTKYNSRETFDVSGTQGDVFGVQLDLTTAHNELASALIYISAWAKSSATTVGPKLYVGGTNNAVTVFDTNWHHYEFIGFAPASGALNVGFGKNGSTAGDTVTYADIVIAVVGASDREFSRDLIVPTWATTAAPTTGTWAVGDVVWNSAPVAAGVPGWVCTTGGTPGTWKAMAAVAA